MARGLVCLNDMETISEDVRAAPLPILDEDLLVPCAQVVGLRLEPENTDTLAWRGNGDQLVVWTGLDPVRPVLAAALRNPAFRSLVNESLGSTAGCLILAGDEPRSAICWRAEGARAESSPLPDALADALARLAAKSRNWAGRLTNEGDHVFDPRDPTAGAHYGANLLLGDRHGFRDPLLTTPKAVVDGWGGGSSRSHANREILATRWDRRTRENGFPANRQFYLVEAGRQIFYSARPAAGVRVETRHAPNHTVIRYEMPDGLVVERTIFLAPADEAFAGAREVQFIRLDNNSDARRDLSLVVTSMLGYPAPEALAVDVVYTNLTTRPRVLRNIGSQPFVVAPDFTPPQMADDRPFAMVCAHDGAGACQYPVRFGLDYEHFVGDGTLECPQGIAQLDNRLPRQGTTFYAIEQPVALGPWGDASVTVVNGLASTVDAGLIPTAEHLSQALSAVAEEAARPGWASECLERVVARHALYANAFQAETPDKELNNLLNRHLPFQVRYQTYVSRSFGLTQKAFRRIGFREIQDLLAAIPFEANGGRNPGLAELIGQWAANVFTFGYTNHQFFYHGIGPGLCSDNGLWLSQAVAAYLDATGDESILAREFPQADGEGTRSLYRTLEAILEFSGCRSVGKHGLPLLDSADWNDTLSLDRASYLDGPRKQLEYQRQVDEALIKDGAPLRSDYSESVMNGFLLELARQHQVRFAATVDDEVGVDRWNAFGQDYRERLRGTWRSDFFPRVLLNDRQRFTSEFLGADGDGCSDDPAIPGTYFLNSFSWSILAGVADEDQIRRMLDRVESVLLSPHGLRLNSPVRFRDLVEDGGSGEYLFGDRENGGVFKHANMMAVAALAEAASRVDDDELACRLAERAWWLLGQCAPYGTMSAPFRKAGNPRFCTQYVNSVTGEHVGPLVSGTAPWMWLNFRRLLGIKVSQGALSIDPLLPAGWQSVSVKLIHRRTFYRIHIHKPRHFVRLKGQACDLTLDGLPCDHPISLPGDRLGHEIVVRFRD